MDIHPLVIHYPVALITLYGLFELMSVRRIQEKPYWFYIKAMFVMLGALGAAATVVSGLYSDNLVRGVRLVEMHLIFMLSTAAVSALAALLYIFAWQGSRNAARIVFNRWLMVPLALAGLALVAIAGGLGGALVYGTSFDPLMAPVFKFLNVY